VKLAFRNLLVCEITILAFHEKVNIISQGFLMCNCFVIIKY